METGYDSWFLVPVDYAFGHAFANDIRKAVTERGGKVLGEVRHPLGTSDMSCYLLQAQASKAKVIAFASAGADMATSIKQAAEYGITGQALVAPSVFTTDIHAMGLSNAKGLKFMAAFYWDRTDETRAWSKRFFDRRKAMPTMTQAGVYSAVRHLHPRGGSCPDGRGQGGHVQDEGASGSRHVQRQWQSSGRRPYAARYVPDRS